MREWLPVDEVGRADRFHFEEDRRLHLTAQAHVRQVLSTFSEIRPAEWRIKRASTGKPFAAGSGLQFSYSHTRGIVVSVVTRGPACGIDVEDVTKTLDLSGLAPSVLGPLEFKPGISADRFFEMWTLKEAYSKALGLGLRLDFRQLQFSLGDGPPSLIEAKEPWGFGQARIGRRFQIAVAVAGEAFQTIEPRRWRLAEPVYESS